MNRIVEVVAVVEQTSEASGDTSPSKVGRDTLELKNRIIATTDPPCSPIFTTTDVESFFRLVKEEENHGIGEAVQLSSTPQMWMRKYLFGPGKMPVQTAEAIMGRLRDMAKPRLATEIADLLTDAAVVSKRTLYFALDAAHAAGLHLLAAPLVRTLSSEHGVPHTHTRTVLKTLRLQFENPADPDVPKRGYQRYIKSAKIMFLTTDRTKVWCHHRPECNDNTVSETLDLPGGKSENIDANIQETLWRELKEELGTLPPVIHLQLQHLFRKYPSAMARAKVHPPNPWLKMHWVHVWVLPIEMEDDFVFDNLEPSKHLQPGWRSIDELYQNLLSDRPSYAYAAEKACRRIDEVTTRLPSLITGRRLPALELDVSARNLKRTLRQVTPLWGSETFTKKVGEIKDTVVAFVTQNVHTDSGELSLVNAVTPNVTKSPQIAAEAISEAISLREVWKDYSTTDLPGAEHIQDEQRNDEWCNAIIRFLIAKTIPTDLQRQAILRFVTLATGFTLRGVFYLSKALPTRSPVTHCSFTTCGATVAEARDATSLP